LVYSDVQILGIDDEKAYSVPELLEENPRIDYFLQISQKKMTPELLIQLKFLLEHNKIKEAFELMINSDPWVKARYQESQQQNVEPLEAALARLRDIEKRAADVGAEIDDDTKRQMRSKISFYEAAEQRTHTMVNRILSAASSGSTGPIAMIIGAGHTQGVVSLLRAQDVSFVLLTPAALHPPPNGNLSIKQIELKRVATGPVLVLEH
jgi:hypothetical protein